MLMRWLILASFLLLADAKCVSDLDCSLNGLCGDAGVCSCFKPWVGPSCGMLAYKRNQPLSAKNLYPLNDTGAPLSGPCITPAGVCNALNTWNGPIVGPVNGTYHMYNPLYKKGSLYDTIDMMHGESTSIEGPYSWSSMGINMGANPAFLIYNDSSGKKIYSLWVENKIYTATSPKGPFVQGPGSYPGGNPTPVFHGGAFYLTNQETTQVWTALAPGGPWTKFADITPHMGPPVKQEDPFMWIDSRGHWHIINHAYDPTQLTHCGNSTLSAHVFSEDGKYWHMLHPYVEPYTHLVHYQDGSSHIYSTLERPNCHFDSQGTMTHINLAADFGTQDAGCSDYTSVSCKGHSTCACMNCKYGDHSGAIIIALDADAEVVI